MPTNREMDALAKPIWPLYVASRTVELRNQLVEVYRPLLFYFARSIDLPRCSLVATEDLESAGFIGLVEAIEKFEPSKGFVFASFAARRIKGAMIDHLRGMDWLSRHSRLQVNKGIAAEVKSRHISELIREDSGRPFNVADGEIPAPHRRLEQQDEFRSVLKGCTRQERLMAVLLYCEDLTMKEASYHLGISESRVSQIHSALIEKTQSRLLPAHARPVPLKSRKTRQRRSQLVMSTAKRVSKPAPQNQAAAAALLKAFPADEVRRLAQFHEQEAAKWKTLLAAIEPSEPAAAA